MNLKRTFNQYYEFHFNSTFCNQVKLVKIKFRFYLNVFAA